MNAFHLPRTPVVVLLALAVSMSHAFVPTTCTTRHSSRQNHSMLQAHNSMNRRELLQNAVAASLLLTFTQTPSPTHAVTMGNDDTNLFRPVEDAPRREGGSEFHAELAIAVVGEDDDEPMDDEDAKRKAEEEWLGAYGALF